MKTQRFIGFVALAALMAACGGDDTFDNHLRITAEKMVAAGGSSKVIFDPADINASEWIVGEPVNVNGNAFPIALDETGYYIDGTPGIVLGTLYAIYPASVNDALGNDIAVTNGGGDACAVDIHSLAINLHPADGRHDVYFPMAATVSTSSASQVGLNFLHLTGGLRLTLQCTSAPATVTRLVVTATDANNSPAIYKDLKPVWSELLLPGVPGGETGSLSGNQNAEFISDMTLVMSTDGVAGVTIPVGESGLTFCIPILARGLQHLTITGYNADGDQVFLKTKDFDSSYDVERNKMYRVPVININ